MLSGLMRRNNLIIYCTVGFSHKKTSEELLGKPKLMRSDADPKLETEELR